MINKEYIYEISNFQKVKVFIISLILLTLIIGITIVSFTTFKEAINSSAPFIVIKDIIKNEITKLTPIGLFYLSLFGGLFFAFSPIELLFIKGLYNGNQIILSSILVIAGTLVSQFVNYFIGSRFSKLVFNFISIKKVYKTKRIINKYGSISILFFSILPLPVDILSFGLGITRYNLPRLFTYVFIGSIIKLIAISLFFKFILN